MALPTNVIDARSMTPQRQSQAALKAMVEANVQPTPENYELWYHYVGQQNGELTAEIETMKKEGVEFTDEISAKLREKYLPKPASGDEEAQQKIAQAMSKLMSMVGQFSREAADYNAKLGEQTDTLSSKIEGNEQLESLLGEVVGQLKDIKKSGDSFGDKMRESQKEIAQLKENLQKATTEARRDGLTGLNNRRAFDEIIAEQSQQAEDKHTDLCLLLLDIDHFKKFNDTYGHQIGDEVIKVVAAAMKRSVRGQDIVARYGGEEFAILLPSTPTNGAHIVAENVRKLIAKNRLRRKGSQEDLAQITISVGITRYRVGDKGESIAAFIKRADDALYTAKQNGRNRVAIEL